MIRGRVGALLGGVKFIFCLLRMDSKDTSLMYYSVDLNTELVRNLNGQKEVGCQMVRHSDHLNTKQMDAILLSLYWSGIQMVSLVHTI